MWAPLQITSNIQQNLKQNIPGITSLFPPERPIAELENENSFIPIQHASDILNLKFCHSKGRIKYFLVLYTY